MANRTLLIASHAGYPTYSPYSTLLFPVNGLDLTPCCPLLSSASTNSFRHSDFLQGPSIWGSGTNIFSQAPKSFKMFGCSNLQRSASNTSFAGRSSCYIKLQHATPGQNVEFMLQVRHLHWKLTMHKLMPERILFARKLIVSKLREPSTPSTELVSGSGNNQGEVSKLCPSINPACNTTGFTSSGRQRPQFCGQRPALEQKNGRSSL